MKRIICSVFFGILAVFTLCSCGRKPYTTDEVKKYIEDNLNIRKYEILKEKEAKGEVSLWTIRLGDGSEQVFHVADFPSYELFGTNHSLGDDYDNVLADYESENFTGFENIKKEVSISEDGLTETVFSGSYTDKAEFDLLFSEGRELLSFIGSSKHPVKLNFRFEFDYPLRGQVAGGQVMVVDDDADTRIFHVSEISSDEEKNAFDKMIIMCVDLNYTDLLTDFSSERIKDAIAESTSCIGICYGREDRDIYEYYDDICGSIYGGAISYPTVYKLLIKEGIEVEGDINHFKFVGKDAEHYEIFYDNKDASLIRCEMNGTEWEPTWTFAHFTQKQVGAMFDAAFTVWKMDYQPNANVYASDGNIKRINTIILDGKEMSYDEVEDGQFNNITSHYKYTFYDEERKTYMMYMDIGWTSDNQSCPYVNHEWVKALGGTYKQEKLNPIEKLISGNDLYKTTWKIGGNTFTTKADFKGGKINSYEIKKNGKKFDLAYDTSETSDNVGATFMIVVTIDDFAELFDLTYDIDQKNEMVNFHSKPSQSLQNCNSNF